MTDITIPNEGVCQFANAALGTSGPGVAGGFLVDLYVNNYTPNQFTTFADFDLPTFEGYSTVTIGNSEMSPAVLQGTMGLVAYSGNPITWTNNSTDVVVYGYLVRSAATNAVLWCQQFEFPTPINFKCTLKLPLEINVFGALFP